MDNITEVHGNKIMLRVPLPRHFDKRGSEFIYDSEIGMWCKLDEYQKLDLEKDNLALLPMIQHSELKYFGLWQPITN